MAYCNCLFLFDLQIIRVIHVSFYPKNNTIFSLMNENIIHIYSNMWDSLFLYRAGRFHIDFRSIKKLLCCLRLVKIQRKPPPTACGVRIQVQQSREVKRRESAVFFSLLNYSLLFTTFCLYENVDSV